MLDGPDDREQDGTAADDVHQMQHVPPCEPIPRCWGVLIQDHDCNLMHQFACLEKMGNIHQNSARLVCSQFKLQFILQVQHVHYLVREDNKRAREQSKRPLSSCVTRRQALQRLARCCCAGPCWIYKLQISLEVRQAK